MKSLRGRLTAGVIVSVTVVFVVQWLLVGRFISTVAFNYVLSRLEHDSDSVLAAVDFKSGSPLDIVNLRVGTVYEQPFSGHYYRVAAGNRIERSRSLWDQEIDLPLLLPGEEREVWMQGPQHQQLLVLVRGFQKQGEAVTVAVAEDVSAIRAEIRRFELRYLLVSAGALLVLILLQRAGLRWGLKPLQSVQMSLQDLRRGRRQRLDLEVPQEVKPLAQEVNRLLESLARRLALSRNAAGNLAHGLKRPLTMLTKLADQRESGVRESADAEFQRPIDEIRSLIERELRRAQIAGGGSVGNQFHPQEDIEALAAVLHRMYAQKELQLRVNVAMPGPVPLDQQDMLELLGNILDNACKWAHKVVDVRVDLADSLNVCVQDDGPGCSAEERQALGQRGVRLDESTAGHGLGLAIARDIVAIYGGTLELSDSTDLGGLSVQIRIPLSAVE